MLQPAAQSSFLWGPPQQTSTSGRVGQEHRLPLDCKPLASLGQTPHLLLPEGLACQVGPRLGPLPTVPGCAPAWALDVQLPGGLTSPGQAVEADRVQITASLAGVSRPQGQD